MFKFSLKSFILGNGKEDWIKASSRLFKIFLVGVLIIVLLAGLFQLKNLLFPKPSDNIYKPVVIALPGSKVDKIEQKSEQTIINQTRRLHLSVGGGLYGTKESGGAFVGAMVTYDLF
jgi:hypothetical protein